MRLTNLIRPAVLGLAALTATAAAADLPPLRTVEKIDKNMLWVGIAIEISDNCPTIDARTLKGLAFLYDLRSQARELGYSDAEIKAYIKSDEEEDRIRALGENYMKSRGLDPAVTADLCTLGEQEIARNSQIGVLLKAK
ncbi:DUF5333 domain-containing protein [Pseudooceanicola sp. 502str34]|uniref:DUF5333 domain-containing protein n=1 Tax=Maritimibacter alkaliphilus TaxID=404236 RepID=UPI001C967610|nr:DUF5333 domain-containing protein [Maritimibacter alkaliphilus]MBY6090139.1 DUF5333 domain-containing protein [Maritimibacter alkaliphilus]